MTQAPEAPVTTAPETPSAPVDGGNLIADATQAYERYEFPVSDAPETAPEKTAPSEPTPQEPAPAAPAPEAKAPEPGELTDEELERVLRHPKGQDRLDRLVNNKLGNRLQQEREAQAKDAKEWDAATSYFQRLTDDDDFYEAEVGKHGEAVVLRYRADYQDAKQARDTKSATPVVDDVAARAEWTQAFNSAAVSEFKDIVKATLPFYGDLPPEVRTAVENASYNPEGNWLGDALTAIGKGVVKHIEGLERRQTAALREATTAGKNDAIAAREDAAPVVVDGSPGTDWNDIYRRYGEGDPKVSRDEFHRALKALGKDF